MPVLSSVHPDEDIQCHTPSHQCWVGGVGDEDDSPLMVEILLWTRQFGTMGNKHRRPMQIKRARRSLGKYQPAAANFTRAAQSSAKQSLGESWPGGWWVDQSHREEDKTARPHKYIHNLHFGSSLRWSARRRRTTTGGNFIRSPSVNYEIARRQWEFIRTANHTTRNRGTITDLLCLATSQPTTPEPWYDRHPMCAQTMQRK